MKYVASIGQSSIFIGKYIPPDKMVCMYYVGTENNITLQLQKLYGGFINTTFNIMEPSDITYKIYNTFSDLIVDYPELIIL